MSFIDYAEIDPRCNNEVISIPSLSPRSTESVRMDDVQYFKLEDVAMGIWIDQFKTLKNKTVDYVSYENYQHGHCVNGFTISHYQNPTQMQCLWSNEMEGEHGICCNNDL